MLTPVRTCIREAVRALSFKPWSAAGSILTVSLAILLAGSFVVMVINLGQFVLELRSQSTLEVFLSPQIDTLTRNRLYEHLASSKHVLAVNLINPEMALYRLRETFGADVVRGLSTNPLPESFELVLAASVFDDDSYQRLADSLRLLPGVDDIGYLPDVIPRLKTIFRTLRIVSLVIGIMVAVSCVFIIGHTIGVMVAGRRLTFYVMSIAGASDLFIKAPYLLLGMAIALAGASIGIAALWLATITFSRLVIPIEFMNANETVGLLAIAGLVGILGALLSFGRLEGVND